MDITVNNSNGNTQGGGTSLPPGTTVSLPFTIGSRTLVSKGSKKGMLSTFRLEEARDHLRKLATLQDPEDHERSLDQLHISFLDGHMEARFLTPSGMSAERLLVSDTGASGLAHEVLPSRFFAGLKSLAQMDEQGAKVATLAWDKFARKASTPHLIRTVNMKVGDEIRRVIRSVHSQKYASYSNIQFLEDLLVHAGQFANLPCLDWRVTDSVMRLRFAGCEETGIELNKPVPMIECWNSEVGMRKVGLQGGMWRLVCLNGAAHWDEKKSWDWRHYGNAERIQTGVKSAFEDLLTTANGVVDAYTKALDVSIDDAFSWLEQEMNRGEVSVRQVVEAQQALKDPTTTPGGSLASVVDAITFSAQGESNLLVQVELEKLASNILRRGLSESLKHGGRILVEA